MESATFKDLFKGKQNILEEKIDTDGLLSKLEEYDVISRRQRNTIEVTTRLTSFYAT